MANGNPSGLFTVTLLAATAGLCLSAYTFKQIDESNRIFSSRQKTLAELSAMSGSAAKSRSLMIPFSVISSVPVDPAAAAEKILPGVKLSLENPKDQSLSGGFTLREVSAMLADFSPVDAGRLVEYLENQNPPWRLSAYEFTANGTGRGEVKLTLQTILHAGAR